MTTVEVSPFNYHFIPGVAQYSAGVKAERGHEIIRARLADTPPLVEAFDFIQGHLGELGLPVTAVCAFEMRSPRQFNEETFKEFNERYIGTLERWGILTGSHNPVARSNVIPNPPTIAEPGVHAFSYVAPSENGSESFVVAGSAEVPEGRGNYRDHIVAPDDPTPAGLAKKTEWVIAEMARRMAAFGAGWSDVTDVQVYTTRAYNDAHAELAGAVPTVANVTWHYCNPPVEGLEFEMDCRRVLREEVLRG